MNNIALRDLLGMESPGGDGPSLRLIIDEIGCVEYRRRDVDGFDEWRITPGYTVESARALIQLTYVDKLWITRAEAK